MLLARFADTVVIQQPNWWDETLKILAGFVLAVVLFILQDWWRASNQRDRIKKYCLKEVDGNIEVLEKCIESITRLRQEISEGNKIIYFDFEPAAIFYKFTADAHSQGLLFDKLSAEEVAKLNADVIGFFSDINTKGFVTERISQYQSEAITPEDLIGTLKWVSGKAEEAILLLKNIKTKLKKK